MRDEFYARIDATLADIRDKVKPLRITRTALILVGRALSATDYQDCLLYDPAHSHVLRPARA